MVCLLERIWVLGSGFWVLDSGFCLKRGLTLSGHVLLSGILQALQRVRPLLRQSLGSTELAKWSRFGARPDAFDGFHSGCRFLFDFFVSSG